MGKACAFNLWAAGYSVALVDMNHEGVLAVAKELTESGNKSSGQKAWARVADVSSTKDVQELYAETVSELGPLYGLVHAAGILGTQQPAHEHDEDDWQRVSELNFVPGMIQFTCMSSSHLVCSFHQSCWHDQDGERGGANLPSTR